MLHYPISQFDRGTKVTKGVENVYDALKRRLLNRERLLDAFHILNANQK
jgi:hypothetical protein